jgi:hypothetical protein
LETLQVRYATTLDKNFLARALCLYESWAEHVPSGEFGFYCMDSASVDILENLALPRAVVVRHEDFASKNLQSIRSSRSMAEYCWTSKPAILLHAVKQRPALDWVVYLDSDMMFFGNANNAVQSPKVTDFLITPHRFSPDFESYRKSVGDYNAGYAAFRNSPRGRQALDWWEARCLEWCGAVPVEGKYADQKYLDQLPVLFESEIPVIKGLNAAPWNINSYRCTVNQKKVLVDGDPLLIFHFQGLRIHGRHLYDLYSGNMKLSREVAEYIYHPYVRRLAHSIDQICRAGGERGWGIDSPVRMPRLIYRHGKRLLQGLSNLTLVAG